MVNPIVKNIVKVAISPSWVTVLIMTVGLSGFWDGITGIKSVQGQISVGGESVPGTVSNGKSLSQQSLQEMQQNISTAGSGSMQMIRFGSQVSFPPLEGVQRILNWQLQAPVSNATSQDEQLSQAFSQFKQLQSTQPANSLANNGLTNNLIVSSHGNQNTDLLPALQRLK
ncbi:MAG: hypothetical protein WCO45_13035 [Pseudanabaena sp. ELA607]